MTSAPLCPYCRKPLPKLASTVYVRTGASIERPRDGDWYRYLYTTPLRTIEDCRKHTNREVISISYNRDRTVSHFTEWDGSSYWTKTKPFCTQKCALAYARAAHRAGYQMVGEGVT